MKTPLILLAVTIADLSAQAQLSPLVPGPQQQTGQASIEGTVVDSLTLEPIKKASVTLNGRLSLTAVTDATGHFAFRQLPPSEYSVQAQSERYPVGRLGPELTRRASIRVAGDEQKRDVTLSLTPGASVRGRILDEEGSPMPECMVSAVQKNTTDDGPALVNASVGAQSDENGEYRIANLPAGKYYVMANCPQTIPLPHALIRRAAVNNLPMLAYRNLFYPGTPDPTGASKVEAQPGGLVAGIDFHMVPASGVTVSGRARPSSFDQNLALALQPSDPLRRGLGQQGGRVNPSTGEFQFANVPPGSYELVAWGTAGKQSYFARLPVEVGVSPAEPIELRLAPGAQISGTLVIEGDDKQLPNPNPIHVNLNPAGNPPMFGPPPQAEVTSDGAFVFESVSPGRWRVRVNGPGYVKSMAFGDQEVSGDEIEITAAARPLKIVMGTKYVQVVVSASPPPANPGSLTAVAWGEASRNLYYFGFDSQGMRMPPGRYHICGFVGAQPGLMIQQRAVRNAMESHCATVDIQEGGPQKVPISPISSEEQKRIADSLDE
jgi:hypothetical protein